MLGVFGWPEPREMTGRDLRELEEMSATGDKPPRATPSVVISVLRIASRSGARPPEMAEAVRSTLARDARACTCRITTELAAELPDADIFVGLPAAA